MIVMNPRRKVLGMLGVKLTVILHEDPTARGVVVEQVSEVKTKSL